MYSGDLYFFPIGTSMLEHPQISTWSECLNQFLLVWSSVSLGRKTYFLITAAMSTLLDLPWDSREETCQLIIPVDQDAADIF